MRMSSSMTAGRMRCLHLGSTMPMDVLSSSQGVCATSWSLSSFMHEAPTSLQLCTLRPQNVALLSIGSTYLLSRIHVATLQACQEAFRCPLCGDSLQYIIIDEQALGFKLRPGMKIVRPGHHLPVLPIDVERLRVLPTATLRRSVRNVLRTGDPLKKTEVSSLRAGAEALNESTSTLRKKRHRPNRTFLTAAAQLFFTLVSLASGVRGDEDHYLSGSASDKSTVEGLAVSSNAGSLGDATEKRVLEVISTTAAASGGKRRTRKKGELSRPGTSPSQLNKRTGLCSPSWTCLP